MAPKPLSKKANHSPCRRLSKVILNSKFVRLPSQLFCSTRFVFHSFSCSGHEKKKFLLKLKEKVTKKKFLNHLITAQNKSIEVITLDDDNEMEVCENVPNMAEKTVEKPAKATVKTATLSSSRRLPVTPFLGLADYIKVCDKPLRLASSAKFGSFESLSNSSSNDSNNDRNLEVQVLPGVDGEISIIETENDDELSVSFFDKDSAKEKDADDVAIVKHIQCDLDARQTIALKKVGHGIVYIDGSCREFYPTGELIAGIGVYWGENDKRNVSQLIHGQVSSNRAEIQAAVRAIATAIEFRYEYVTVYTDR